jgi:hypothetical protein
MQKGSLSSNAMQSIRSQLKLKFFEPNMPKIQPVQQTID